MTIPAITPLPDPPARVSQSNTLFVAAMDAWFAAQQQFADDANAMAAAFNNIVQTFLVGTSVTSVAIGSGSKSFTTQAGLAFSAGQWLIAASSADPSNYVLGPVTSYNAATGALVLNVPATTGVGGSGTHTDWQIGPVPLPISRVRSNSSTSITSPLAFNSDLYDGYTASAQAADFTISADAGTPTSLRKIVFSFTCDGTPRTVTFTGGVAGGFVPIGVGLTVSGSNFTYPLVANKTTIFAAIYSATAGRWRICGYAQEA